MTTIRAISLFAGVSLPIEPFFPARVHARKPAVYHGGSHDLNLIRLDCLCQLECGKSK